MKQRKTIYLQLIMSLILVISLVTGCVAPGQSADKETDAQTEAGLESSASYEKYEKAHLDAQEHFDQMMNDLFLDEVDNSLITLHYTLANPAAFGITDYDKTLGTVTLEESKQALADAKSLKVQLNDIDSRHLREDQLLTYTILSSYLNTMLSSEGLELYDQPLSSSLGIQAQLPILLSEYVFYTKQDVEDYLSLLSSIDTYYESIIEFEKQKTEAGLGLCDTAIDRIIESCNAYLLDADHSFMAETFAQRLDQVEGLTDTEKGDYSARNRAAINEHFVPAYQKLIDGLTPLKGTGTNDKGLYYFPEGQKYYQYLVNAYTGTSYQDIPELKKAISDQMMNDLTAMDELLTENPALAKKMYSYSFSLTDPNEILENLRTQCIKDFPAIEDYVCNIKNVPSALEATLSPAFYLTVPIDRPQDNSIYINNGSTNTARNLYSTLAHEGYPGHMYQTLYFNRNNSCNLRKLLSFSSYSEGWATYVEYYSYTLDNGLDPDLGELLRHNAAFTLSLYAILDLNIHYEGWDIKQVQDYLNHYFRISDPSVITTIYYDIAENPANYLEYYVGYLEILNMQSEAKKTLGSRYTNMEFNRFLLDIGPAPFSVIKPYFNEWLIEENK
ncbi:DUF885 domain-containing protein [Enterocloster citroniae]|uniref:DUF885 domain-containing protein n=1 Tax=Enterocloster citroniae TaxID=358743 RepID=UPI0032C124C6